jgi:hypothetical protein
VSDRRTEHGSVGHAGKPDIVEVIAVAGHQLRIFTAAERLAYELFRRFDCCSHDASPSDAVSGVSTATTTSALSRVRSS